MPQPFNAKKMTKINLISTLALLSVLATVSCAKIQEESFIEEQQASEAYNTKVVKFSEDYDGSSFLVKFNSVPDEAVIESFVSEGVTGIEKLFTSVPGKEELEAQFGLDRWYVVSLDKDNIKVEDAVRNFSEMGMVQAVEFNSKANKDYSGGVYGADVQTKATSYVFNDPLLTDQWHYINGGSTEYSKSAYAGADINVKDVWRDLTCGDPSIIVAVVDEGVKYNHPDLAANMWVNEKEIPGNGIDDDKNGYVDDIHGYNFVDKTSEISWSKDGDSGHGTHTSGTIAAVNNNGIGVSGVAGGSGNGDGCRIMSCQIFSGGGGGFPNQTANAIKYAADNGASIISCSFGYSNAFSSDDNYLRNQGSAEIDAIHYFEAKQPGRSNPIQGAGIAIFSAGNESHDFSHYPGAFVDIISVSSFGPDLLPAYYTCYGPGCNIAAPGGERGQVESFKSLVLSTLPSELPNEFDGKKALGFDYGYMQGTSMACPHVSGVVALGLSYAKKLGKTFDRDEFKKLILASTQDIDKRIANKDEKKYVDVKIEVGGQAMKYPAHTPLKLAPFYHKMGTGAIDAWSLMMHIEGIPSTIVETGDRHWVDLSPWFGTSSVSLTYLGEEMPNDASAVKVEMSASDREAMGITEDPYVKFGRLYVHPTKLGSGKVTIRAVGGGDHLGGGSNPPGGMEISQTISIISRPAVAENGGWL